MMLKKVNVCGGPDVQASTLVQFIPAAKHFWPWHSGGAAIDTAWPSELETQTMCTPAAGGRVFQFGACKDKQTAMDTKVLAGEEFTGAATYAFCQAIEKHGVNQTYASVSS